MLPRTQQPRFALALGSIVAAVLIARSLSAVRTASADQELFPDQSGARAYLSERKCPKGRGLRDRVRDDDRPQAELGPQPLQALVRAVDAEVVRHDHVEGLDLARLRKPLHRHLDRSRTAHHVVQEDGGRLPAQIADDLLHFGRLGP